jgi:hypothetical protein
VVVVWLAGLWGATSVDDRLLLIAGIPLTLLAGVLIDRWWAAAVPWGVLALVFAIAFANDPSCSDCGEDPWNLKLLYGAMFFACPATALIAIGVGARRLTRFFRDLPPGDEPGGQHA